MSEADAIVYVIDDDPSVRAALDGLLRSVALRVRTFGSAQEFLAAPREEAPGCIVLDVRLPGASGLEFQRMLGAAGISLPVIFITGHGDIPMSVQAMREGAIEFLTKPFRDQDLLDAIHDGLGRDAVRLREVAAHDGLARRFATLTPRERAVMALVIAGQLNKQIAAALSLSEVTVKAHRGQVMRKMEARSLADLVRMGDALGALNGGADTKV
ncbi:MAG: response regulator transcription factor [Variibacter sp.]